MLLQAVALPPENGEAAQPQAAHFLSDEIAPRLMVRISSIQEMDALPLLSRT